jgi:uncharacterized protein (TIGR04255 family)
MTFPRVEARRVGALEDAPLRAVLVQAKTPPVLALERAETVEQLVVNLAGRWTLTDRQRSQHVAVTVGPSGVRREEAPSEPVWILTSADGGTRAIVSPSSVSVESNSYSEWVTFRERIVEVFAAVQRTAEPPSCTRLGVRYVNEVDVADAGGDTERLAQRINPVLLAPAIALDRRLVGSQAELRVADGDDAEFALRHGLVTPDTYLLDFDAYRAAEVSFDASALVEQAEAFHARIESVFAWSLSDAYLEQLSGSDAGGGA